MGKTPEYMRNYRRSESGKAAIERFRKSEKGRAIQERYLNSEQGQETQRRQRANRKRRNREIVDKVKSRPCADCGGSFDIVCMDLHHYQGKKEITVGWGKYTPKKLMAELDKCVVLCACCHRLRHKRTGPVRNPAMNIEEIREHD